MALVHDRMPVILDESRIDEWMNSDNADAALLRTMLEPAPGDWLIAEDVSPLVNNVKNDGPELLGSSLD
jgi:putative SOS response-associated peptidase YedK